MEVRVLLRRQKRDGVAEGRGASGPADAMKVVFGIDRHVEIDHVRDSLDVDPACGDVGGDHDLVLAVSEAVHRALALALGAVGVHGHRDDAGPLQALVDLVGAVLGAGEDQDAVHLPGLEHVQQQVHLLLLLDGIPVLGNRFDGIARPADLNHLRVLLDTGGQRLHFGRDGSREEHRLTVPGQLGDNRSHVVDEAHVQHAVGLVEHEHLHVPQIEGAALHVVHQSARRGDDDINAATQGGQLPLDTHAAIDGRRAQRQESPVIEHAPLDLHAQFACRRENQGPDDFLGGGPLVAQPVQNGQHEGRGFAGAGLGTADDVLAANGGRKGPGLNLRGGRVAGGKDALHQRVGKTE